MPFRSVVTTRAGVPIGELLQADPRRVGIGVNRNPSAGVTVRLDNPLADALLSGATLLKVYETGAPFGSPQLRFVGEVAGAEEVSKGDGIGSAALTFGGPYGRFAERLIGKTATGYSDGTALAPKDKAVLAGNIVTAANAEGYTGVDLGTVTNVASTGFVAFTPYKPANDALAEVVNLQDGPDFRLNVQEPQAVAGGTRLATIDFLPALGSAKPGAVFEYGYGRRNVASYRRAVTYNIANAIFAPPPASAPASAVVSTTDATSITAYGRREALVSADLPDAARQLLVNEHLAVRKAPRQVIAFTPVRDDPATPGRVPRYGIDYELGDTVTFRAVQSGRVRVNAAMRVYGVEWSIDANGNVVPTIALTAN